MFSLILIPLCVGALRAYATHASRLLGLVKPQFRRQPRLHAWKVILMGGKPSKGTPADKRLASVKTKSKPAPKRKGSKKAK